MSNTNNILVTGGAGYIGSHTVVELVKNGFNPIIVDDFRNSHQSMLEGIEKITGSQVTFRELDVCDEAAFRSVFEEFDFTGIIHFAALKAVGESVTNPLSYYKNNISSLVNCIELATEFQVDNFVFSSSCTVYGESSSEDVVTENTTMKMANSPYGYTKQIGEQIITDVIASESNIRFLSLRYFNPVGAHESSFIGELPLGKPNNLLPIVTQCAIGKYDSINVNGNDYPTGDGTCVRDYVHVSDVANAHVKGLEWLLNEKGGFVEAVNIGTGKGTSVLEIIHTFEEVSGRKLNWNYAPRRDGDIAEIRADVTKAKNLLKWESKRSVRDAVLDAWNWELKLNND